MSALFDTHDTNLNIAVGEYARQGQQVFALVDEGTTAVVTIRGFPRATSATPPPH